MKWSTGFLLAFFLIVSYVEGFFEGRKAYAQQKKCWAFSSELASAEEILNWLNAHDVEPHNSYVIHAYRGGLKWYIVYQYSCK